MSKSIIIKKNGGPEVLELQDIEVGSPGPDEIKVTNYAIGLNYIDTYHRSGLYPINLPSGIGLEASGKVEEIGSNVTEFNKGDNIAYASIPLGAYSSQRLIPAKIAIKVIINIPIIIAPGIFLIDKAAIIRKPIAASSVSGFEKFPNNGYFASSTLNKIIPPASNPIIPINKPTPAPIAILKFIGMLEIIQLLRFVTLITKNKIPAIKTAPSATSQEYSIFPTTVYVKKTFKPIPGARPIGQFAKNPITKHAIAAAMQVPTKIASLSIPLSAIIEGLAKIMYAIVKKVVIPAIISVLILVLLESS